VAVCAKHIVGHSKLTDPRAVVELMKHNNNMP
jgi:hypothetical protein